MKKILSFFGLAVALILPLSVKADVVDPMNCTTNADGSKTCTVVYEIPQTTPQNSITITLIEKGGASITTVGQVNDGTFTVMDKTNTTVGGNYTFAGKSFANVGRVWNVTLASVDSVAGTYPLFTFTYTPSGESDCAVVVGGTSKLIQDTPTVPDTPAENPKTGSTLPYIALGSLVVIAVGVYAVTKNKSKMYKI